MSSVSAESIYYRLRHNYRMVSLAFVGREGLRLVKDLLALLMQLSCVIMIDCVPVSIQNGLRTPALMTRMLNLASYARQSLTKRLFH